MGLSINQNIAAVNSYRNLSNTQNDLGKSLEKLSSGFRINRAADDAAGLAISEGLRSQVGGLKVAARNAQDGISVVQTAEGALTEVHSILQRLRDLGVQGANDSNNGAARNNITTEATNLVSELDRIAKSTNFNGTTLLDKTGAAAQLKFQVGADGDPNSAITVDLSTANVANVAQALQVGTGGAAFDVVTPTAVTGNLTFTVGTDSNADGDFADGGAEAVTGTVTFAAGAVGTYDTVDQLAAALNNDAQFSANLRASVNKDNQLVVNSTSGQQVAIAAPGTGVAAGAVTTGGIDFSSHQKAQDSIDKIDTEIGKISTARANLGAMQNRFEHTIKNVNVAIENLSASESRIRDTDMASEMVSFTRAQILSQAGTAMLAQANQIPQGVLSLLR